MNEVIIGRVRTPHGVRGHLKLQSYSGDFDHFFDLTEITLVNEDKRVSVRVESITERGNSVLLKIKGIESPEDARKYSGWDIVVPPENASKCEDGEYYIAELAGCRVVCEGEMVGIVVSVCDGPQADLIEIEKAYTGKRYFVPFMEQYVGKVDIAGRTLEVKDRWLLE